MIDFALGVFLVFVLYRGYRRGFIREILDLLLLVIGAVVAFRSAGASAAFFESWTGASPIVARTLGAFTVFFVIQVGGGYLLRRFLRGIADRRSVSDAWSWSRGPSGPARGAQSGQKRSSGETHPDLSAEPLQMMGPARTADRVGGSAVAGAWFVIGVTMFLLVASAVPFGPTIERLLEESRVVELVAGKDSAAKRVVSSLVGDRVLESLVNLNQLVGDRQVVIEGTETVIIPVLDGDLVEDRAAANEVFELLNRARVDAGVDPLAWSEALAEIAGGHGLEMYRQGYFSHLSPTTGTVADRMAEVGILYRVVGENLALSPTPQSVHEGLFASPGHRENMLDDRFTRVGVSAVEGPLGLMVVEVFSG